MHYTNSAQPASLPPRATPARRQGGTGGREKPSRRREQVDQVASVLARALWAPAQTPAITGSSRSAHSQPWLAALAPPTLLACGDPATHHTPSLAAPGTLLTHATDHLTEQSSDPSKIEPDSSQWRPIAHVLADLEATFRVPYAAAVRSALASVGISGPLLDPPVAADPLPPPLPMPPAGAV